MITDQELTHFIRDLVKEVREGRYLESNNASGVVRLQFQRYVGEPFAPPDPTDQFAQTAVVRLRELLERGG